MARQLLRSLARKNAQGGICREHCFFGILIFFVRMGNAKASLNAAGNNRVGEDKLRM